MVISAAVRPTAGSEYAAVAAEANRLAALPEGDVQFGQSVRIAYPDGASAGLKVEATKLRVGLARIGRFSVANDGTALWVSVNSAPAKAKKVKRAKKKDVTTPSTPEAPTAPAQA